MKKLRFVGDSIKRLRLFPEAVRKDVGYQLERVQFGEEPEDVKYLVGIGSGIQEIRSRDESGAFRVVYIARFAEAIYVLHAFQKKSEATQKRELELVRQRIEQLRGIRERL